jgi:hypothetical protein
VPLSTRPEQAPDFAGTRQVSSLRGTKSEVLAFPGLESGQAGTGGRSLSDGPHRSRRRLAQAGRRLPWHEHRPGLMASGGNARRRARSWHRRDREPVVRIRPAAYLLGILAGRLDLRGQGAELVTASLPDDGERPPVPRQPERHLVGPARTVMAENRRHVEQRPVYAA